MIDTNDEAARPPNKIGSRHVQVFLLFLGMAIAYALRVCMSVALEAMTDTESQNDFPIYGWKTEKGYILSSFFWGYVLTQVPAGQLASTHSAQKLLALGIGISAVINMFTPLLAQYGAMPVIASRVAMGLLQGCLLPCVQTLLSRWVPPAERARLGSLVMNGPQFGTVVTMPISGLLSKSDIGWPSVFYIFSVVAMAWSVLFYCLGADRPSEHPRICPKEVYYINSSLGNLDKVGQADEKPKTPWKALLTSLPMWSLIIVHCGHNWGFYLLLTKLPAYMKNALHLDIAGSGLAAAIPYLAMWLLGFPISWVCDFALQRNASVIVVRKISNSVGLWVPAAAMIALSVVTTTDKNILIGILAIAIGFNSGITCGFQINHIDLSPNFAGIMMSLTNGAANVFGIIAPIVCDNVVDDPSNVTQWHIMFYVTALVYFASNTIFLIFGRGDIQSWNYPEGQPIPDQTRKVSVISITGEPISVTFPERIKEDEI